MVSTGTPGVSWAMCSNVCSLQNVLAETGKGGGVPEDSGSARESVGCPVGLGSVSGRHSAMCLTYHSGLKHCHFTSN